LEVSRMYSAVLMLALTAGNDAVDFGRSGCSGYGCSSACSSRGGLFGGHGCSSSCSSRGHGGGLFGGHGCSSSCSRGGHGGGLFGGHGCSSSCSRGGHGGGLFGGHGCRSSCSSSYVGTGCSSSYGCSSSCHGSRGGLFGGHGCSGGGGLFHRNRGCNGGCYASACSGGAVACTGGAACTGGTPIKKEMPKGEPVKEPKKTSIDAPATINVTLPAEARLLVDGAATKSTTDRRTLITPTLQVGSTYVYNMTVEMIREGRTISQTQQVAVAAGETINITFTFPTQAVSTVE
jgi:uncharacterized protein (TIGR03000 family)